jgi:3-methyladenine DNA glycosylase Mpg
MGETLSLEDAPRPEEPICAGPRVGVRGDEAALSRPWRYFLKENPYVSRTSLNRACDSIKLATSAGDSASE